MSLYQLAPPAPPELFQAFPELPKLIVQLLFNRGIKTKEQIKLFLKPDFANQHDPFLFKDMEKCISRVWQAINNNQKIVVYADYDADAVTAASVMVQTFRYLGVEIDTYIPDRFSEGYGLNLEAFEKIRESQASLVITVDCGINSVEVADYCNKNNIDLIITDHHELTGQLPEAFAVINPKVPGENYPDDQITGVGVAYKFCRALLSKNAEVEKKLGKAIPDWDKWLLDLVAIGTVADCHSLLGENRILVSLGLKVLAKTKWPGLRALMLRSNVDPQKATARDLGFALAPRINAAGRLEHAGVALACLIERDPVKADELAVNLDLINTKRKDLTARIISEATEQVITIAHREILLVSGADWPMGVVGIVAGRLTEMYKKPSIVLARGQLTATGSARSTPEFDIVEAFKINSELLIKFGGHKQAAGLTIENEKINDFYLKLLEHARTLPDQEDRSNLILVEAKLEESDLYPEVLSSLLALSPFGAGNPDPVFLVEGILQNFKEVGQGKHLGLNLRIGESVLPAIAFNFGFKAKTLSAGQKIVVSGNLQKDEWNGRGTWKLRINNFYENQ